MSSIAQGPYILNKQQKYKDQPEIESKTACIWSAKLYTASDFQEGPINFSPPTANASVQGRKSPVKTKNPIPDLLTSKGKRKKMLLQLSHLL